MLEESLFLLVGLVDDATDAALFDIILRTSVVSLGSV
jgi:hypothetical protein